MEEGGTPPASGPDSGAEGGRSNSPVRRISWILGAAIVLFGAAYFLGDLRPERSDGGGGGLGRMEEEPSEPAAIDTLITPDDLPGFETADLTNAQRLWLYHRAHREECACGCGMTVAQCRVEDPTCPESPGRSVELVQEARDAVPGGNGS